MIHVVDWSRRATKLCPRQCCQRTTSRKQYFRKRREKYLDLLGIVFLSTIGAALQLPLSNLIDHFRINKHPNYFQLSALKEARQKLELTICVQLSNAMDYFFYFDTLNLSDRLI